MQRQLDLRPAVAFLCLSFIVGCGAPEDPQQKPIVFGLVPSREANVIIESAEPLAEMLSRELGRPVESFVPQDYTGLVEAMGSGQADIGMLPPFASVLGEDRYGIETVLISVRRGHPTYRAQWMTRQRDLCRTSPVDTDRGLVCEGPIAVVQDGTVAFTDPTSTSGHLFPALQLLDSGIHPERDIQGVFVGSHDASAIAVMNGDVDFGVAFEDVRGLLADEYPEIGQEVMVFNYSPPIPNDGVTVRGDLEPELKAAIRQAFLKVVQEQASLPLEEQLLWRIYEIEGFVPFEPEMHDVVRRAYREMRDKIDLNS